MALDAVRAGDSGAHLLWFGDSHTAADFMTGAFRSKLATQLPSGGPGFVHLGLAAYRHDAVRLEKSGTFRHEPKLPAQRTVSLDGVFGLGGIRTIPEPGARLRLFPADPSVNRLTLVYRTGPNDVLAISWPSRQLELLRGTANESLTTHTFELEPEGGPPSFTIEQRSGRPELFGAFLETSRPGVVLDTLGINGARVSTMLAWESEHFEAQVRARNPALVILAFGTNEIFDRTNPERYLDHYKAVIARIRRAAPESSCLLLGAPDAAAPNGQSLERVQLVNDVTRQAANALGCGFLSLAELMGGESSFTRWRRSSPPLARGDNIHFTVLGYRRLGELIYERLFAEEPPIQKESTSPAYTSSAR